VNERALFVSLRSFDFFGCVLSILGFSFLFVFYPVFLSPSLARSLLLAFLLFVFLFVPLSVGRIFIFKKKNYYFYYYYYYFFFLSLFNLKSSCNNILVVGRRLILISRHFRLLAVQHSFLLRMCQVM